MRISDWSSDVCSSDLRVSLSLDALQSRMAGEQRTGGGMKTHGPIEAVGAAVSPPPAVLTPAHDTMRRLQIGLAGLLTVLLLVGLAGVIGNRARESAAKEGAATAPVQLPGEGIGRAARRGRGGQYEWILGGGC